VLPVAAGAAAVLLAGGGGAYLVYGKTSSDGPVGTSGKAASGPSRPAAGAVGPDVCALLSKPTLDRLVPKATVSGNSRDGEYSVDFNCSWINSRISFGEFWRGRQIEAKVRQHRGQAEKTGRAMAQVSFEAEYGSARYGATAKPTGVKSGEKDYTSPVKDVQGVGDQAFAQYTWRRTGNVVAYAFGRTVTRVGDMTIEVKFQAEQRRKDAPVLTNEGVKMVTEENAVREAALVAGELAKGVAAWQAQHPGVLAKPRRNVVTSPSPKQPTTSPSVLAAFPPECEAVTPAATRLVPSGVKRARFSEADGDAQTECRWLNLEVGLGGGRTGIRSVLITTHRFTNRAGAQDPGAAKAFYAKEYGSATDGVGTSTGGITWGKVVKHQGLGEAAFSRYLQYRRAAVHNGNASVTVRLGATVVQADLSGADRPKGEATNSPKVVLMPDKQAREGALSVARAYVAQLAKQPGGG
jgi:hypothetical protein